MGRALLKFPCIGRDIDHPERQATDKGLNFRVAPDRNVFSSHTQCAFDESNTLRQTRPPCLIGFAARSIS
jgi:hypothetical protein